MKTPLRFVAVVLAGLVGASCHASSPKAPFARRAGAEGAAGGAAGTSIGLAASGAAAPNVSFAVAQSPLALTASDGTGLRLAELHAEAVIDGPLAFTELRLTFENPLDRVLEGTFRITLPRGASVGRFAMKIDGQWQEGEVVELSEARRAYEDFLHRKQDPALMEKSAGNEFSARVFPIPARGVKEIVVAYTHEVHEAPYVLPLRGLPELGVLDVKATVMGAVGEPPRLSARTSTPDKDFVVDVPALTGGVRSGEFALLRVKPATTTQPDPISSAIVLVDTSASRVLGFEDEITLVDRLMTKLAETKATVTVAAFDQGIAPIFTGAAASFGARELAQLRERGPLGASDLERALEWARAQAKKSGSKRVILVSDGVATAGSTDPKTLVASVGALKEAGIERLDALAVGGIRDDAGLLRLVRGQLARDGIVADAAADPAAALRRLGEATRSGIAVKVEGATWSWPTRLDGVQAGDTYSIYAQLPGDREVKISVDGKPAQVAALRKTERPLLERSVNGAKIASMLEREATTKTDLKKSIVTLAVEHRIMTPYTAMLVLETEQDYARFHIDRRSLRDVLAVQGGAVKRVRRTALPLPKGAPFPPPREAHDDDDDGDGDGDMKDAKEAAKADPSSSASASASASTTTSRTPSSRPRPQPASAARPGRVRSEEAPAARTVSGGVAAVRRSPPRAYTPAPRREPAPAPVAMSPRAPAPAASAPQSDDGPRAKRAQDSAPLESSWGDDDEPARRAPSRGVARGGGGGGVADERGASSPPYEGKLATVMESLASQKPEKRNEALAMARAWQKESPGDVLALVALGEAAEAKGLIELAGRAYGSVIDLFPNRADLRRFAGERLERLKDAPAASLAIDSFRKALADRPDHPSSHRLLAFALLRDKHYEKAFEAAVTGSRKGYDVDRFAGVERIMREDLGLVGAAWARAEPAREAEILSRIRAAGGRIENAPSLRFVLDWQTDTNDVDFHIRDARGGHAFYGSPQLEGGGDLYADVTTGYGPECFTIRLPKEKRSTYRLEAHYYSRGPMGYGMGKLEIIDHDGKGNLTFEERPFTVMVDSAYVDLGSAR